MQTEHTDRHAPRGSARILDGRYRIGERIARGGMASVHRALDLRLDREVAVKIMHPSLGDDPAVAARFVREARAAARLSHPNVVAVYDQGEDDGTVFLAMELVPGRTLRDVIAEQAPMRPSRALALLEPILGALAAAHRAGLMHRDVKPENVLIADDGRVKVADFGLARAITSETQHTATGVLIGTVSYIAPELVSEGTADARADVYAAGVMLYEMLTGRKPHEGESPIQVAYKHVHTDVPPPSELVPGIPDYVDALVARATVRDRTMRPADAGVLLHQARRVAHALANGVREDPDLVDDLRPRRTAPLADDTTEETFDPGTTIPIRAYALPSATRIVVREEPPAPPAERTRRPRRRRRWGPLVVALLVLVLGAVAAGAWWYGDGRWTSTPGVLGLAQADATSKLETAGLDVEVGDPVYSDTVPAGAVISSDPEPGGRVLDGGTVTLTLSQGVEQYELENLAGRSLDEAQDSIGQHFTFGTAIERFSEKVAAGEVIRTRPAAGKVLRPGTSVDVVVSKGRRPIEVGDWIGEDADEAERTLEGRGLVVVRDQEEFSDTVASGDVISQNPSSGTLFKGETVTLVVSKGPDLVQFPDGIIGQGLDAARAQLEGLGFQVDVQNSPAYIGLQYVLDTDPKAGDMVPRGSRVTLYLV